jgi:hypothetical protein
MSNIKNKQWSSWWMKCFLVIISVLVIMITIIILWGGSGHVTGTGMFVLDKYACVVSCIVTLVYTGYVLYVVICLLPFATIVLCQSISVSII